MTRETQEKTVALSRKTYNELLRLKLVHESETIRQQKEIEMLKQENCYLRNTLAILKS
ncbi:MAG: hypothetical protein IKT27_02545 [Clostridia bacterium]|nr:hypothetical protein [Clostridia bacterium]